MVAIKIFLQKTSSPTWGTNNLFYPVSTKYRCLLGRYLFGILVMAFETGEDPAYEWAAA